jgi:hypothetical protein
MCDGSAVENRVKRRNEGDQRQKSGPPEAEPSRGAREMTRQQMVGEVGHEKAAGSESSVRGNELSGALVGGE